MTLTQLAKPQWQSYFDRVAKALGAKLVQVEITGLGLGDQVQAESLPLIGISYDPRNDILAVALEGIEHNIQHPKQIHVERDMESVYSIEAVDAEGEHHILLLRDPLRLPAP
ncbi:MAG: DUF5335 family protein [Sulfuricella sp.]|nr:DUF5335 domain-containing protein [Gammaproteobacteria bacterium]